MTCFSYLCTVCAVLTHEKSHSTFSFFSQRMNCSNVINFGPYLVGLLLVFQMNFLEN